MSALSWREGEAQMRRQRRRQRPGCSPYGCDFCGGSFFWINSSLSSSSSSCSKDLPSTSTVGSYFSPIPLQQSASESVGQLLLPSNTRIRSRWFLGLLGFFLVVPIQASNQNNHDKNNQNSYPNYDNNNQNSFQGTKTGYSSSAVVNPEAFLDVEPICDVQPSANNALGGIQVEITSVYLTCDSPGAYYQGSKTYRNSPVCTAGDKAKVNISVFISEMEHNNANEVVYVHMDCGFYKRYINIYSGSKLCKMDITAETTGTGTLCPTPGRYYWKTYFDVPEGLTPDESIHFTPDLRFYFTNSKGDFIGCATTGSMAWHRTRQVQSYKGIITLAVAVSGFMIIFALLLWLSHRRRKRLERLVEHRTQRYQYFRTLPNGQVVPFLPPPMAYGQQQHPGLPPQYHNHHMPPSGYHPPGGGLQQHYHPDQQYYLQQQQLQQQYYMQQQQYHYHNTLQQGGGISPARSLDSSAEMELSRLPPHLPHFHGVPPVHMISNPSYNETHLPTRPII